MRHSSCARRHNGELVTIYRNKRRVVYMKKETLNEKIDRIVKRVIFEELSSKGSHKVPLLEMATFGVEKWGKDTYKIAVHGASTKDRPTPHLHIYLNNDTQPYSSFNFEISFVDLLCKGEIVLIYQCDRANNVKHTNRRECSWEGYSDIYEGIKNFLLNEICKPSKFGTFTDNIERAIYEWNRETDYAKTMKGGNPLKEYLDAKGLTVLPQFKKYFE